jgi:hypothetical protein
MFALRNDDVLVIYEEMEFTIMKSNINLKNGSFNAASQVGETSLAIQLPADSPYTRLILNFSSAPEMVSWHLALTASEEVSVEEPITSPYKRMTEVAEGQPQLSYKSMSSMQSTNFLREHKLLVNRALKDRLDEK